MYENLKIDKDKLVLAHQSLGKLIQELEKENVDPDKVEKLSSIVDKAIFFSNISKERAEL